MMELRRQSGGDPQRAFCAFDPKYISVLLISGTKTRNARFYDQYVPTADTLYDDHLEGLPIDAFSEILRSRPRNPP